MMTIAIKGLAKLIVKYQALPAIYADELKKQAVISGNEYIRQIRRKYYNGRKGNTGLNRISHQLHNNWIAEPKQTGKKVSVLMRSTMIYSVPHEYGDPDRGVKKRTDVTGDIKKPWAVKIFTRGAVKAFRAAYRRK